MDKKALRERLRGYQIFNEWERQEERRTLPHLTIEQGVQQFLGIQRLMRHIAPGAREFFFEDDLSHRVRLRSRFKQIVRVMENRST